MELNQLWSQDPVYQQVIRDIRDKKNQRLNIRGLQGSAVSFFVSSLPMEKKREFPLLVLAHDTQRALHLFQDILSFTCLKEGKDIFIFPAFEVLPYEDIAKDSSILAQRIKTLSYLAFLKKKKSSTSVQQECAGSIIVSTYHAVLPKMISALNFYQQCWKLKCTHTLDKEVFLNHLISQGFQSASMIDQPGEFSQRGGIIDLFPFTEDNPIRIELFGNQIESIRFFDPDSQRSIGKINEFILLPQTEQGNSNNRKGDPLYSFFQYLPSGTNIIIEDILEFEKKVKEFEIESQHCFLQKKKDNIEEILPPSDYYLNWEQITKSLVDQKNQWINLGSFEDIDHNENPGIGEYDIKTNLAQNYFGKLDLFFKDIQKWQQQKMNILVITTNKARAGRLAEVFDDRGINNYQLMPLSEAKCQKDTICLSYGKVNYGFQIPSLHFLAITDQEIFGRERDKSHHSKKYQGKPFYNIDELKMGDYVVHIEHGIGKYAGIYPRKREGIRQDYLLIQYAAGDELYVPVDQLNLVHKYIGVGEQTPKLYRLGGNSWNRVKGRVKKSIQKIAHELYELYRQRKNIKGFPFAADSVWQQELEMAFPFEETPDQNKALSNVKKDMQSPHPMERLICGDVGYGKTEIAIRAAFKAVMDGKQVAVLAPTTILAQQHWENFSQRMKPFPVKVEMLSRFKSKPQQQQIIADLKEGKIDIIIGTHRLVQKDIVFHDLGLLVIDEEQRFGVIHKERIKRFKKQIDSLTLTATPIPRTLYFSLIGVREMSLINTPPELRLPIITHLSEKKDDTIKEAITREIDRGGQVYYVHNRVQDIEVVVVNLKRMLPEARIVSAHGQMPEEKLENIMVDFFNHKYDILVCTTIIEIGLDIPNVNTIIIDEAHRFGLAQLYQLRGRVGRADRRAYAYLLYSSPAALTDNAKKRLEAIKEFSDLGSGFRLAMRDLEIRGAGNLLGKEQHGFVSEIGFNFYCQLLESSVRDLKEVELNYREEKNQNKKDREREPEMIVRLDSYIPDGYISDAKIRVAYYQKISQLETSRDIADLSAELKDIYGPYPEPVRNMLSVINLKLKLKKQGIKKIKITPHYFSFQYEPDASIANQIKSIPANQSLFRYYKKGADYELKLLAESDGSSLKSDHILDQADRFLEKFIACPH